MFELRSACALILFAGAVTTLPPTPDRVREFGSWCLRPARLPFAWRSLEAAREDGDAREVFARGQQIMQMVPSWADGHAAFVYNYVLTQDQSLSREMSAKKAEARLYEGLAMLEQAREHAGKRERFLLQMAAYLPDLACDNFPGLNDLLRQRELAGGASSLAATYLAGREALPDQRHPRTGPLVCPDSGRIAARERREGGRFEGPRQRNCQSARNTGPGVGHRVARSPAGSHPHPEGQPDGRAQHRIRRPTI